MRLSYTELEEIISALSESKRNPKLRRALEKTASDIWRYLP